MRSKKRVISWLLACTMLLSMLPGAAFAEDVPETSEESNAVKVIMADADIGEDQATTDYEFQVELMTADGALNILPQGTSVTTGAETTLAEILDGQPIGDHVPMYAVMGESRYDDGFMDMQLTVGQSDIQLYMTGCVGHELTLDSVSGGKVTLAVEMPTDVSVERITLTDAGETATIKEGYVLRVTDFEAADGFTGEPQLTINGQPITGAEYTVGHENVNVSVAFAEQPDVIVDPELTLDVTSDCSVQVTVDGEAIDLTNGKATIKAGSHVTVSQFSTSAEYKYDTTDVTLRLGDAASEKLTGESYVFIMPNESVALRIEFGMKTAVMDGRYYIAAADFGGKSSNTGAQESPLLSITEAIEAAKAANQETVEIIFKSDIRETDVRALHAETLGCITSLTINGNNNQLIYNGQKSIGESEGFLEVFGGSHVALKDLTVTRTANDFEARLVHVKGAHTTLDMEDVTLTGGWVEADSSNGGSALWVETGATVTMDGTCKVIGNETTSTTSSADVVRAGAILVGTYGAAAVDVGTLNIHGAEIRDNTSSNPAGNGIYVMPRGELNLFASNDEISVSDEIYLESGCHASIGAVTGKSDKLSLTRVFLAGNASDMYKEATLDICGETDKADINVECSETNHYAYRLISRQMDGYEIDASMTDRDETMDESGWEDIDGKWDIRYMNVYDADARVYVPGLYFIYHMANIQFRDTRTVENIYGKDLTDYQTSSASGTAIAYLKHENGEAVSEARNATIIAADTTGAINGATGLKGEEMLYIPEIVPVGANVGEDYVITFDVNDEYQLPPMARDLAMKVVVSQVTKDGPVPFDSAAYTYAIEDGKGVITIAAETLKAMAAGATIDVKLSAEKIYNLTIQMNGPLYTRTRTTADGVKTVEQHTLLVNVLPYQGDNLVTCIAGYDLDGNDTIETPRAGVNVTLYAEGTVSGEIDSSRILGTAQTDENGMAEFELGDATYLPGEVLNNQMSFFVVPYYEDTIQVVDSDIVTLDVTTMHGHRLRALANGAVDYTPSEITAETKNWNSEGTAAQVILTDTRADTRVICYSNLAQTQIYFDRNAPEGCTTANSEHCKWIFQSVTGGDPVVLASTDTASDVRAKAMEAAAVTYGNLPTMTMTGYQFKGWATTPDATEPDVKSSTAFDYKTSPTTLYAVWAASRVEYKVGHWIEYVSQTVTDAGSQTSGEVQGRNPGFVAVTTPVLAVKDGIESEYVNLAAAAQAGAVVTYYRAVEKSYQETADVIDAAADVLSESDFANIGKAEGLAWWTLEGFEATPEAAAKILADGTAVFMTKYDRKSYEIHYDATPGRMDGVAPTTHKFGDIIYAMPNAQREGYDFTNWVVKEGEATHPVVKSDIYVWTNDIDVYAIWTPHTGTEYQVKIMIEELRTDGLDATEDGKFKSWQTFMWSGVSNNEGAAGRWSKVDLAEDGRAWMPDGFTYIGYLEDGDVENFQVPGNAIKNNGDMTYTVKNLNGDGTTVMYLYFARNEASVTFKDGVLNADGSVSENPAPNVPAWEDVTVTGIPYHGQFGEFFPETNPGRAGYDFDGWQDKNGKRVNAEDYTEEFCDNSLKRGNDAFVLYPIWKVRGGDKYESYFLTYVTGDDGKLDLTGIKLNAGSDIKASAVQAGGWVLNLPLTYDAPFGYMPVAVRTGYDFTGWYLDAECETPLVYSSESFRLPGDTTTDTMTQDGYVRTIADISNVFIQNADNTVERLRPVYAGYEAHQHTLVLDVNGGMFDEAQMNGWTIVPGTNGQKASKVVTYGQPIGKFPVVSREGFSQGPWALVDNDATSYINEDTIWASTATNRASLTATVQWVNNRYTYTLDLNDEGNGSTKAFLSDSSITDITVYYNMTYAAALKGVQAQRNGYTFLGWSLNKYNCEDMITTGTKPELITADTKLTDTTATTLHAVWMPNVVAMKVYLNGGTADIVNDNDDNLQNTVFNQNAYANRYYGKSANSYFGVYNGLGANVEELHAVKQTGYILVPVVFDTVYGELPAAIREGADGEHYVFGGYKVTAPGWRVMYNGVSTVVINGQVVRELTSNTLVATNGLFNDHQDAEVRLDALWTPVFVFDVAHHGVPTVDDDMSNLCKDAAGALNGDEHTLSLNEETDALVISIVRSDLDKMPEARKQGFTFLGWYDNAGVKYELADLQRSEVYTELYAKFTPTVIFLAQYENGAETGTGYVTIDGQKYGKFEIGLSQLLEKFSTLPSGNIDDGRVFLGWTDKAGHIDASVLSNLQGLKEPITLIPDFDYVAIFHLPAGANWKPSGTSETKIVRLSNLSSSVFNGDDMHPMMMGCTFSNWVSTVAPYERLDLEDLLKRDENGAFTKSYRMIASFTSGGVESGDAQNINIDVLDYTKGKAAIAEMLDGKLAGKTGEALSFTVSSEKVASVALRRGDKTIELKAKDVTGGYEFTIDALEAGDVVVLVLTGDITLNGETNSEDLALLASYMFHEYAFEADTAAQYMAGDVTHNGETNSEDLALLASFMFHEYDLVWNVTE